MRLTDSQLWISDLDETIDAVPEIGELAGKSIMITGCTGLICSAIVDLFIRWNERYSEKIIINAAGRSLDRIKQRFPVVFEEEWFRPVIYDAASTENQFNLHSDFIIHGASNASPNKIVREPVETMLDNVIGIKYLLDYAKQTKTEQTLLISSSEVYGKKEDNCPNKVDEYGFVDILNPRNSYAEGKRAAETLCASYYEEYGVDSVIVRPGHIYGPTANESDNRVSSMWPFAVAKGEDIIMKSEGLQIRSYCYCLDCASAIITVLLRGRSATAYNISNPDSIISIRELAEQLAESADVNLRIELPTKEERKSFNPMSNSSLDSTELIKIGWKGLFDAKKGLSHTVSILKELQ